MESKDFHKTNAYAAELTEKHGASYAAVIRLAGNLHQTLTSQTTTTDQMYVPHVEGRYRALLQLDGMKAAAIAIGTDVHGLSHGEAERGADVHIAALAKCIREDVDDNFARKARATRKADGVVSQ